MIIIPHLWSTAYSLANMTRRAGKLMEQEKFHSVHHVRQEKVFPNDVVGRNSSWKKASSHKLVRVWKSMIVLKHNRLFSVAAFSCLALMDIQLLSNTGNVFYLRNCLLSRE